MDHSTLPKLLPSWKGIMVNSAQRLIGHKNNLDTIIGDDFDIGGSGVDLVLKDGQLICDIKKHNVNQVHFNAQVCSLPFIPPNKISIPDPCFEKLGSMKKKAVTFCSDLYTIQSKLNKKIENEIQSAHNQLKNSSPIKKKLFLPESVIELANNYPDAVCIPDANTAYSGGVLSASKYEDGKLALIYPTGKRINKLTISHLEEHNVNCKLFRSTEKKVLDFKKSPIQQVESSIFGFCYVRQENQCHFVNYSDLENLTITKCEHLADIKHLAPSPYYPSEVVVSDKKSYVQLTDIELREVIWKSLKFPVSPLSNPSIEHLVCEFGSHPRSVLCLADSNLFFYDLRIKNTKETTLFTTRHSSCYFNEKLAAVKRTPVNPFQYFVSSSYHLYVLDERYPAKPVLIWNHPFNATPLYCDATSYQSPTSPCNTVALLGTQESREIAAFRMRSYLSGLDTVSLGLPLLLSSPTDFAHALQLHCTDVPDHVMHRLKAPLVGLCVVPHASRAGFTAFQATSLGDVFYQDFEEGTSASDEHTYHTSLGCKISDPRKILPQASSWMDDCPELVDNSQDLLTDYNFIQKIDLRELMSASFKAESSDCQICNPNSVTIVKKEVLSDSPCSLCGLSEVNIKHLQKKFESKELMIGSTSDLDIDFDPFQLHEFQDEYSQKLLQIWVPPDVKMEVDAPIEEPTVSTYAGFTGLNPSLNEDMFSCDFILPSQDLRPTIGETLKTPFKKATPKKSRPTAGF